MRPIEGSIMLRKETSMRDNKTLSSILILGAVLAACAPETQPDVSQSITDSGGIIESNTPQFTPTVEATPTQEATATPERTEAENMHEYCIQRAREAGIDLENIDNSNNLWFSENQYLEGFMEGFETSFSDDRVFKTMLVVGIDSLNSQARYDQAPTTADDKKIIAWIEAIYKNASGQYQMVLLPINIWNIETELMWDKSPIFSPPRYATKIDSGHHFWDVIGNYDNPNFNYNPDYDFRVSFMTNYARQGYWMGPGAFINFDSEYPGNEEFIGGAGMIEDPNYSEEQLLDFRSTGNADFFPYFMIDKKTGVKTPFIYPFVNYATFSKTDDYQNQTFIEELVSWTNDSQQWRNPDGPPFPQHWQTLP
jgi:hypothetical protein